MTDFIPNPAFAVADETALRALFPATHELAVQKVLDHIDPHARSYIERSPFVCIGTQNADGKADVSPRGDPAGFIEILDERTLAIPDRPGNNRLDTLSNIVSNPSVALLFIVPGFDDTMRINGQASITTDPAVLERLRVQDRLPKVAIIVKIETVFIHCAKAFRRSKLWDPTQHQDRGDLPSLIKIVMDQTAAPVVDEKTQRDMDEGLEEAYRTTMY